MKLAEEIKKPISSISDSIAGLMSCSWPSKGIWTVIMLMAMVMIGHLACHNIDGNGYDERCNIMTDNNIQ